MARSPDSRSVSDDDVRKIAALARLRPSEEALEQLTEELNGILEHVRLLETLDEVDVRVDGSAATEGSTFRDPELKPDDLAEGSPEKTAPDWREGFFVVPRLPALDQDSTSDETGP